MITKETCIFAVMSVGVQWGRFESARATTPPTQSSLRPFLDPALTEAPDPDWSASFLRAKSS